jgi:predicted  nucleic acid-binding Zn-ribbon protein
MRQAEREIDKLQNRSLNLHNLIKSEKNNSEKLLKEIEDYKISVKKYEASIADLQQKNRDLFGNLNASKKECRDQTQRLCV